MRRPAGGVGGVVTDVSLRQPPSVNCTLGCATLPSSAQVSEATDRDGFGDAQASDATRAGAGSAPRTQVPAPG
jgi:hypothetical protein